MNCWFLRDLRAPFGGAKASDSQNLDSPDCRDRRMIEIDATALPVHTQSSKEAPCSASF
jgi:hypothetical protein